MKLPVIKIFNSNVLETKNLTHDVKCIRLSVPDNFEFKAGQYLSLSIIRGDGKKIRKPFSISNSPKKKNTFIEFCIKIVPNGLASEFIKTLKQGNEVELFGPAGKFTVNDFNKDLIFIAAGVGIAPFRGIIADLLSRNFDKEIILLKSARSEEDSLYDKEFGRLSKEHTNFKFYNIFSNPKNSPLDKGYVQDFLDKYTTHNFTGNFYICGLKEMIEDVKKKLQSLGFEEKQIFYEKFD